MDWKNVLGSIAPLIGTALGGPFGGLAGTVLGSILGVDDPTNEEALAEATKKAMADPNKIMQLKEAEMAFKAKMKEIGLKENQLYIEDTQSARKMQVETKSNVPAILTFMLIGLAGFLVYFVMTSSLNDVDKTLVGAVVGYVFSEVKQATSFWLGSSKGSQDKNIILENGLNKK
ncbi:MAG: hypothetical protein GY820_12700 [Gammaproteobacteria bacterium]|nr:hypothetical protein [Bacteroidota bacterium]MCP4488162.1 hypothetical protein [Gammaproteobacteria bacterium]